MASSGVPAAALPAAAKPSAVPVGCTRCPTQVALRRERGSDGRGLWCAGGTAERSVCAAASAVADVPSAMSEIVTWGEKKTRLQTQVLDLAKDTVAIRSLDWDRDRFDIEFGLQNGTTYNSYLIFGDKVALVDASHEKFSDLYGAALNKQLADRGRKIDYIIVSHTEPDHSGLIPAVLDQFPEATVIGSKVCIAFLKGLTNRDFASRVVKGGDTVDLGGGHELEFVMAPNLHWPDTMFSYDPATGIMFTCDAFGMHYCSEDPFDTDLETIEPHYRFYYDCLMAPNSRSVLTALKKVKDIDYRMIGTGHGPVLSYNVSELVGQYRDWSTAVGNAPTSVAILYCSDYGYSDRLSQTIARGITKAGVATEMVDVFSIDQAELREIVAKSAGVVVFSPPTSSTEAQKSIGIFMSSIKKKLKVVICESYGGSDEPVDTLLRAVVNAGVDPIMDPLRIKETPDEALFQRFEEAGTDLAQSFTAKASIAQMKKDMPPDIAKAIARLSSGLYVVTAARNNARSAMIASWVAQASFEPLGFTIAVAKDRAIESLLQVGDAFVLNCLGEQHYSRLMKHFLQRFEAGQDRFEGVDWIPASNGSPILKDAIAFMECKVVSRLETADHWITYCEVVGGNVSTQDEKTAVHRRKVGYYY
eukprot:evm.model.scf_1207.2 EVM.evm.TU.scf_1207.2   scf_1207:3179-9035(+)